MIETWEWVYLYFVVIGISAVVIACGFVFYEAYQAIVESDRVMKDTE